jgi:non-specific serine/threonine protein kinase
MLETVREFGLERLDESGEASSIRTAHAAWVLNLAQPLNPFPDASGQRAALPIIERDLPNVRAALTWLLAEDPAAATRLAALLGWFWWMRGRLHEGAQWNDRALARAGAPSVARAVILAHGGFTHAAIGDHATGMAWLTEGKHLATVLDDREIAGFATSCLGTAAEFAGDEATARQCYDEALALAREIGNPFLIGDALINLGDAACRAGRLAEARALSAEGIAWLERSGEQYATNIAHGTLGWVALHARDLADARHHAAESLSSALAFEDPWLISDALVLVGGVALAAGEPARAARLLGAAESGRGAAGSTSFFHHGQHAELVNVVRSALREPAFATATADGGRLTIDDAAAEAWLVLRGAPAPGAPCKAGSVPHDGNLSPREAEVLRLVARGLTDQQIADILFISYRTATTHVRHILGKLGVENRTEAAAEAVRRGLV